MADIVNGRCHNEKAPQDSPPLFQNGKLVIQLHHIGWLVSGIFTIAATIISFWLMGKHLQWYTNKAEQRYIVRILLMVPLYAVISTSSYLFWNHSTPLLLLRDCYESVVLTSFFYLLLLYISPNPEEQKEIFRKHGLSRHNDRIRVAKGETPKNWMFPLGRLNTKPQDGLYFLQMMKWGVLQYCVIRPGTTLAAIILDNVGLYCEDSWSPGWGHIYITVLVSISVSISMYCLIQLYACVSSFLAPQKPLLKLLAIKAVVFLTFWQATMLSLLSTFGFIKETKYMTAENINIGIGAIMETVEMTLFAILHLVAFSYRPYVLPSMGTKRLPALLHAFNFMETYRELRDGTIYMWHRIRGRETDVMARRQAVLEDVFGKSRIEIQGGLPSLPLADKNSKRPADADDMTVEVTVEETVHVEEERQWLGLGNDYGYGLGYHSRGLREKSLGLEEQVERELAKRGYGRRQPSHAPPGGTSYHLLNVPIVEEHVERQHRPERSWWRSMYTRISGSDPVPPPAPISWSLPLDEKRKDQPSARSSRKCLVDMDVAANTYDDPPPPSSIRRYKESKLHQHGLQEPQLPLISSFSHAHAVPAACTLPQLVEETSHAPNVHLSATMALESVPSHSSISSPGDSFLARAFPPQSTASHSTEALTATDASSQSHHTQVQLAQAPFVVPSVTRKAVTRKPVRYTLLTNPAAGAMNACIERGSIAPGLEHTSSNYYSADATSSRYHLTSGERIPDPTTGDLYHTSTPYVSMRHVPRRDQIVLPALLAPVASLSAPAPPSHLTSHAHEGIVDSPSRTYTTPPMTSSYVGSALINDSRQLRRSRQHNMRRNSHAFMQQPPSPAGSHRPLQTSQRSFVPLRAAQNPIHLEPPYST